MRDPYQLLGVPKTASTEDIKRAYRNSAKRYHPDSNKSDPKAKDRFAEISSAYEIIGDVDKRAKYDKGEIDAEGKPVFSGFSSQSHPFGKSSPNTGGFEFSFGGPFNFGGGDIFGDLFGAGNRSRGAAQNNAGPKQNNISGELPVLLSALSSTEPVTVTLTNGRQLEVKIPPGAENGQKINLRGQGENGGDAILTIKLTPHPLFRIEGRDVYCDLQVSLDEAVLGSEIEVPTIEARVKVVVPKYSSSGRSLRLRGKGLLKTDGSRGDLFYLIKVILPEKDDPALDELMQKWRSKGQNTIKRF